MEKNAYKILQEIEQLLTKDKRLIVSAQDLSYVIGQLRAMLTLYHDDLLNEPEPITEARRAPRRGETEKKPFWGLFG